MPTANLKKEPVKIGGIIIVAKGEKTTYSLEEARQLYEQLKVIFGKSEEHVHHYHEDYVRYVPYIQKWWTESSRYDFSTTPTVYCVGETVNDSTQRDVLTTSIN